jgi:hypothetical protein
MISFLRDISGGDLQELGLDPFSFLGVEVRLGGIRLGSRMLVWLSSISDHQLSYLGSKGPNSLHV